MGNCVSPFRARSARISPTTEQNLKPCPEHAEHSTTCGVVYTGLAVSLSVEHRVDYAAFCCVAFPQQKLGMRSAGYGGGSHWQGAGDATQGRLVLQTTVFGASERQAPSSVRGSSTLLLPGRRSRMKCLSGVLVNMQGAALHIAPSASIARRTTHQTGGRQADAAHAAVRQPISTAPHHAAALKHPLQVYEWR